MVQASLHTFIELVDASGTVQISLHGDWMETDALAAAEAYLALLGDITLVRVTETLPWGEQVAHTVYRGLHGVEIQRELPYAPN